MWYYEASRHPAIVLALLWPLLALAARAAGGRGVPQRTLIVGASAVVLLTFVAVVFWYASREAFFDPAEPTIGAVAFVFGKGKALYPGLQDPERYAHVYGPVLFFVQWAAFALAGPSILASKAVGAVAILASLAMGFAAYARRAGPVAALAGTALCAVIYLGFENATFWPRADPLLILIAATALYLETAASDTRALLGIAALAGLAVNLKITGVAYVLPALLALRRPKPLVAAAAIAVVLLLAAAPFLLPNVSLMHYLVYIRLSARNGLLLVRLQQNLEAAVFLGLPVAFVLRHSGAVSSHTRRSAAGLAAAVLAVAVAGAKPGGSPVHLLPFVPIAVALLIDVPDAVWRETSVRALMGAFAVAAIVTASERQGVFIRAVSARPLEPVVRDLREFAQAHPATHIGVGYAGTSYYSYARPEIVFATGDYLIDAPAVQEYRLSNADVLAPTIRAVERCAERYWLIPRDGEPFGVPNAYAPRGPADVFPAEFRARFRRHHTKVGETAYFDVWACH